MDSLKIWIKTHSFWFQVILIFVGLLIARYYYSRRRIFALGNKLPGPKPWPIVGNVLYFAPYNKKKLDLLYMINNLNSKYGFTRFWLGHQLFVFACTAEDAKTFYSSSSLLDRSDYFRFLLEPIFGGGLPTANGTKWKEAKQLVEPLMGYKFLIKPSSIYQEKSDVLVRLLDKKTGSTFSVCQDVAKCILDISCEIFAGCPIDLQEESSNIHDELDNVAKFAMQRLFSYWQHFDIIFKLTKAGKRYYQTLKNINDFIKRYSEMYTSNFRKEEFDLTGNEDENSKLRSFILQNMHKVTDEGIRDYVLSTVGTSIDTTGTTISFALMMLGKHPDIQQKLYDEICPVAEKGFDDAELKTLSYLDRVIKETFRLFSPIPMSSRKASEDVLFGEHLVPKGTSVQLNIFAIHRDPNQYENPEAFDPDHFLPENVSKRHPYSFIPFGMGKRKCVGGNFGYIVIRLILAKIIYNYRVECDWNLDDIVLRFYIVTRPRNLNYPIRLYRR